jgi:hydrogenase maturation factor
VCLGEIGRVHALTGHGSLSVEIGGRIATVSAMTLDAVPVVGAWVLVHSGFVVGQLTEAEAREALDLRAAPGTEMT